MVKMAKKNELLKGVILGILLATIIISILFSIVLIYNEYSFKNENILSYAIALDGSKIIKGEDLILFYDITNWYGVDVENVIFQYKIRDVSSMNSKTIKLIKSEKTYLDTVSFSTDNLEKGTYTVFTRVTYVDPLTNNMGYQDLTLGFEIY